MFPDDLIAEIFCRLPVKTLVRFKCISKSCESLIDDPDFIKAHLNRSLRTNSNLSLILKDWSLYSVDFDSLHSAMELNRPLQINYGTEAFGCCNGLVGLSISERDLALLNVGTRRLKKLPFASIDFPGDSCKRGYIFYGFGHEPVSDDYKVLRMVQFKRDETDDLGFFFDYDVKVYSLKSDSWKKIVGMPYYVRLMFHFYYHLLYRRGYGVLVNGVLHWVLPRRVGMIANDLIIAFDLRAEEFGVVSQPDYGGNKDFVMDIGVLAGCLCVICNYEGAYVDVWEMKEYGLKEPWTKMFTIPRPKTIKCIAFLRPLAYSKGGDKVLLLVNDDKLEWYDLKTKRTNTVRLRDSPRAVGAELCVQSLIPLGDESVNGGKKQQEQEDRKHNRKKRDDFLSEGFKLVL